jgi:hypothetical protein
MAIKSASDLDKMGNECILLMGPPKVGKTSLVCSGSKHAGPKVKSDKPVKADDVLLIQVDPKGHTGGRDCGYDPMVWDLSHHQGYAAMSKDLIAAIAQARAMANEGKLSVVGIDLGALANELVTWCIKSGVVPSKEIGAEMSTAAADVDWNKVSAQGLAIYRAMRSIPCTVVAQAHVRVTQNNPLAYKESPDVQLARDITSVGGTAARATADLAKGVITPWIHASSLILARNIEIVAGKKQYLTYTSGSDYQTGNRRQNSLPPTTDASLKELMQMFHTY